MSRFTKLKTIIIFLLLLSVSLLFYYKTNSKKLLPTVRTDYIQTINPEYLNYISSNEEQKSEYGVIPSKYSVTYLGNNKKTNDLPSRYDLRNVDGVNYISPLKNQGVRGLCWAFSTVAEMESSVMKISDEFINNPMIFSEYHLDFALSSNGILNYEGNNRKLETGNSLVDVSNFINMGYSPVLLSNFGEDKYLNYPINYSEVFEVQNTEFFFANHSRIVANNSGSLTDNIKKFILEYGPVTVSTQPPLGNCSYEDDSGNMFIDTNTDCTELDHHAMAVIGWDDDYTQTYEYKGKHYNFTGAWILKNSWGDIYSYIYLAYNETGRDSFYSVMEPTEINYDYSYNNGYNTVSNNTLVTEFNKANDTREKIMSISFYHNGFDGEEYKIYVSPDGSDNYKYIDDVVVSFPGRTSIDLSNYPDDITTVSGSKFLIKVQSERNESYSSYSEIIGAYAFTKILDNNGELYAKIQSPYKDINYYNKTLSIVVTPNTRLKKRGLSLQILDDNGLDLTSNQLSLEKYIKNNQDYIFTYKVNTPFSENEDTNLNIKAIYNNSVVGTGIIEVKKNIPISPYGDGSEDFPFIINTEEEFLRISEFEGFLDYNYVLGNDLDFSSYIEKDFYVPIGTAQTPFTGVFDGNNHSISNLNANYQQLYTSYGIFGYTENATIKNLRLYNCNFSSSRAGSYFGLLVGKDNNSEFSNITISGGESSINATFSGSVVGNSNLSSFANVYSNYSFTNIEGMYLGGIIGYMNNSGIYNSAFFGELLETNYDYVAGLAGIMLSSTANYIDISVLVNNITDFYGISYSIENSIINNFLIEIRSNIVTSNNNSYISFYSNNSLISNIYEIMFADYNAYPISSYNKSRLINIRNTADTNANYKNIFDMDEEHWAYEDKPYLKNLDYTKKKVAMPGVSNEYLFDVFNLIIYNVRTPNYNEPLTYADFKDNFAIFNGDAYTIDNSEKLSDNDVIKTGTIIKVGDTLWRVAVTGNLNIQNNSSGIIDIGDAILMLRYLARFDIDMNGLDYNAYSKLLDYSADLDCSGEFNIGDVTYLRRKLARYPGADIFIADGKSCYFYDDGGLK